MEEGLKFVFNSNHNYQREVLASPGADDVSKLYTACKNGDIDTVKELLHTIPYDKLNRLEHNGSTPLHAATYYGHSDIVHLLLHEYSCQRHFRNRQGLTAYEVAKADEMRQLFRRPADRNRFNDDSDDAKQTFQIVSSSSNETGTDESDVDDNLEKPDHRYLIGYEENTEVQRHLNGLNGVKALFQSRIGRYIMEQGMKLKLAGDAGYGEEEYAYVTSQKFRQEALQKVLDEYVTPNHYEYKHCCHLLNEYIQHDTIESLLKLYTLETPFYRQLIILSSPLGFPLFFHLADLKQRYYQGYSYRGVSITRHELSEYRWALKNKDSVLSLMTFSSTSIIRDVAEHFLAKSSSNTISTLLVFHFPQPCDTAINLSQIPEYQLPCISNYENEREVLIAPRTFFKVTEIKHNRSDERCTIYLEHVCGRQLTVWKALKYFVTDDLKKKTSKLINH